MVCMVGRWKGWCVRLLMELWRSGYFVVGGGVFPKINVFGVLQIVDFIQRLPRTPPASSDFGRKKRFTVSQGLAKKFSFLAADFASLSYRYPHSPLALFGQASTIKQYTYWAASKRVVGLRRVAPYL